MDEPKSATYRLGDDPVIRFCGFYALLYLGSLIVGGVGILLIVMGLMFLFTRVISRTTMGQTYIRSFFGLKQPDQIETETHSRIYKIATISIRLILFVFYLFMGIVWIWSGIKFLLDDGFLNQNLIYILFFKFK